MIKVFFLRNLRTYWSLEFPYCEYRPFETSFPYVQFVILLFFFSKIPNLNLKTNQDPRGCGKPAGDPHVSRTSPVFVQLLFGACSICESISFSTCRTVTRLSTGAESVNQRPGGPTLRHASKRGLVGKFL